MPHPASTHQRRLTHTVTTESPKPPFTLAFILFRHEANASSATALRSFASQNAITALFDRVVQLVRYEFSLFPFSFLVFLGESHEIVAILSVKCMVELGFGYTGTAEKCACVVCVLVKVVS